VRLYERLVPTTDYFSDGQKRTMLQTAVNPLQELCQVQATAAMLKVHHGKNIDYESYISLLLSTASDYDSKNLVSKNKLQVYQHDMVAYDDDVINNTESFDIDTPVDITHAYASNFRPRSSFNGPPDRVCMPKDKWFSLDQKTKELWDQIDDKQKAIY
jgi:hypothetical protein